MPSVFTPLLAEGREAQLDLGLHGYAPCRITGFAGPDIFLQVDDRFADAGELTAYLLLDDGAGHLQALRGRVHHRGDGTALLHLTDAFSGQRRLFSRAPLVLPAHVRGVQDGAEWDTFTRDISAGGVGLTRQPAWDGDEHLAVTLSLGADVDIEFTGVVLRVGDDAIGLQFRAIDAGTRALLAELALAYHRQR
jgi:hypothetical protein